MKNLTIILFALLGLATIGGCNKTEPDPKTNVVLATVGTSPVVAITGTSAISGGNVTSDGGGNISAKGVCWSSSSNAPTLNDAYTVDGSGIGSFTSSLTDLSGSTMYYIRAYATNSAGTAYGDVVSFTTLELPTLSTLVVSNVTGYTASSGGSISSAGNSPVIERGVVWSINPGPTTANSKTIDGSGTGVYASNISGLTPSTTYYVRSYATNNAGTAYGNEVSFATSFICGVSTVTDIDGNVYGTVNIGGDCWLQENLRVTKYNNGIPFDNVQGNTAWMNSTNPAWCDVDNLPSNSNVYGKLYNGYAVSNSIAPEGWHIPTEAEFANLVSYLGGTSVAGGKMKATTTWNTPNVGADNSSGFTAVGTGNRYYGTGTFDWIGSWSLFWTTSAGATSDELIGYRVGYNTAACEPYSQFKNMGFPIRCVKD